MRWTHENEQWLIEHYPSKGTLFCCNKFNISVGALQAKCNRLGIKLNVGVKRKPGLFLDKTYAVDHKIFESPTTPEVCYLLGFIWGDGHVSNTHRNQRITISCVSPDIQNLENVFSKTGKWTYRIRAASTKYGRNEKEQTCVRTHNRLLTQFLADHDYLIKSGTSPSKILATIPKNMKHYWYRGYIDADGNWFSNTYHGKTVKRFNVSSSFTQDWSFFEELCGELQIHCSIYRKTGKNGHKSSNLNIVRKDDLRVLFSFVYPMEYDNIGLKRKYDKAYTIIN